MPACRIILDNDLLLWDYEAKDAPAPAWHGADDPLDPYDEAHTPGLMSFQGFEFPITCVGLVVPSADRFEVSARADAAAKYLLVVCTTGKIELLALMFDGHSVHNPIRFQHLDYVFPTDGVNFMRCVGTSNGRILLAGTDGCVHELDLGTAAFTAKPRSGIDGRGAAVASALITAGAWVGTVLGVGGAEPLSKRVKRVNHDQTVLSSMLKTLLGSTSSHAYPLIDLVVDHERNLAYTLGQDGSIRLYNLGPYCTQFELVATLTDIDAAAAAFAPTDIRNKPTKGFVPGRGAAAMKAMSGGAAEADQKGMGWPLTSLHVVPQSESRRVHLVATARSGTRFFFSTYTTERYKELVPDTRSAAKPVATEQRLGRALTLTYIRLPPPYTVSAEYKAAKESPDRPGFAPVDGEPTLYYLHDALVTTGVTLAASKKVEADGSCNEHLVAISRDYLRRDGSQDRGVGLSQLRFHESAVDIPVSGHVYAVAEVPQQPSLWRDPVFTPSGAMLLGDGEAAPLPAKATEVRCGKDCVTDTAAAAPSAVRLTGVRRPREDPSQVGAYMSAPLVGAVVPQESLLDSGVLQRYHHLVRRRLWDAAPGWGETYSDFSQQYDPAASSRTFTVLTNFGAVKLKRVRPIDQFGRILANARFPDNAASRLAAQGAAKDSAVDRFLAEVPRDEVFAMCVAISCGALDPSTLTATGGPGYTPPAVDALMSDSSVSSVVKSNADRMFDLYRSDPGWTQGALEYDEQSLVLSSHVLGMMFYLSRLLRPVWTYTAFIKPPALPKGDAGTQATTIGAQAAPKDATPDAKLLLPRFTAEEMLDLGQKLNALVDFMKRHFDIAMLSVNLAHLAEEIGWCETLGLPRPTGKGPEEPRTESAKLRRAKVYEVLYVMLAYQLTKRASEAVHFLAAAADPAYGAAHVLSKLNSATTSASGLPLSVPDADLRRLAEETRISDIISKAEGVRLAEGLFTRVLAQLREKAPAPPDASSEIPGRNTAVAEGLSAVVFARDPASRLAAMLRDKCPSFFSEASQLLVTAQTSADAAGKTTNSGDRTELMRRSLDDATKAVSSWTLDEMAAQFSRLAELARTYRKLGFASGALMVLLAAATQAAGGPSKIDALPADAPAGSAGASTRTRSSAAPATPAPAAASSGASAIASPAGRRDDAAFQVESAPKGPAISKATSLRLDCYTEILDVLEHALAAADSVSSVSTAAASTTLSESALQAMTPLRGLLASAVNPAAASSGLPLRTRGLGMSSLSGSQAPSAASRAYDALLSDALRSRDGLFHDCLYRWMIAQGLQEQLLRIQTDFLEPFLRTRYTDADLLVGFYVTRSQFAKAAHLQFDRASEATPQGRYVADMATRIRRLEQAVDLGRQSTTQLTGSVPQATLAGWQMELRSVQANAELKSAIERVNAQLTQTVQMLRTEARRLKADAERYPQGREEDAQRARATATAKEQEADALAAKATDAANDIAMLEYRVGAPLQELWNLAVKWTQWKSVVAILGK
jgi:hypothetical protein